MFWLYLRFTLSLRDVEDLLAERGVAVSYETVRRWVNRFRPMTPHAAPRTGSKDTRERSLRRARCGRHASGSEDRTTRLWPVKASAATARWKPTRPSIP